MKIQNSLWFFLVAFLLFVTQIGFAQNPQPDDLVKDSASWFSWLNQATPDWKQGGLLVLLGLVGSLVTIFGFIGGSIPGIAGQATIVKDEARLELLSNTLEQFIMANATSPQTGNPHTITAIQETVNNLRDDLRNERWRQFFLASILYAFLGAFFATMLADDLLEALVIGAGWTALIGSWGLKKDYAERKVIKDESAKESQEVIKELVHQLSSDNEQSGYKARPVTKKDAKSPVNLTGILDASGIEPEVQNWIAEVNRNAIIANRL